MAKKRLTIPHFFKPLLWSYNFFQIDPEQDKKSIVLNTINHGSWEHWQWIVNFYGKSDVKKVIVSTPASEFRTRALKLACLLFGINKLKYASRSDYIKAKITA